MVDARESHPVVLEIPTNFTQVRIARLAARGFGANAGLDIDSLDDLSLAVDEACAMLLEGCRPSASGRADRFRIEFSLRDRAVQVAVTRLGASPAAAPQALTTSILGAVCSTWHLSRSAARIDMSIVPPPHREADGR
jgi:anti-sigma regulatory factor (Ser/Thr protein kinase)